MMTTWSSEDHRAYRMGDAIKAVCIAEGGWMDWGADGKVRFLNRGPGGVVGVYFSDWVIQGMKANREKIKRYVELCRELEEEQKIRERSALASGRLRRR